MQLVGGIALPDSDLHFASFGDSLPLYQAEQYTQALEFTPRRRFALDIGAHVGLFSRRMAADFAEVVAYEPDTSLAEAFRANVPSPNVYLIAMAASDHLGTVEFERGVSGWSHVLHSGPPFPEKHVLGRRTVDCTTVDRSGFPVVDFIKIDVQGHEAAVLRGARETLLRCRPTLLIEEKVKNPSQRAAVAEVAALLTSLGARRVVRVGSDAIWVFA